MREGEILSGIAPVVANEDEEEPTSSSEAAPESAPE